LLVLPQLSLKTKLSARKSLGGAFAVQAGTVVVDEAVRLVREEDAYGAI
jgi:hypothetical protein